MHSILFEHSTWFSKLFKDYIKGNEDLRDFYTYAPTLKGLVKALESKAFSQEKRDVLVEVLLEQYQNIEGFDQSLVKKNILALKNPSSFTVTTGQQLHPFLGPEMVFNKIQATIDASNSLSEIGESKVVPIFWMASEDHDFEEVKTIRFLGKEFDWEQEKEGAVGRMPTRNLVKTIQVMIDAFQHDEKVVNVLQEYKDIYSNHNSFAEATREIAFKQFAGQGLVAIDADNSRLKEVFKPYLQKEIKNNFALTELGKNTALLNQLGYKTVLNPMGKNLFLLREHERTKLSNQEAEAFLSKPDNLSPNVVLRPVYQEVILPNLAYFAGPSELSYWLQLKAVFNSFDLDFPVLMPRRFTLTIKSKDLRYLEDNEYDLIDLYKTESDILELMLAKESEEIQKLLSEKEEILNKLEIESKKHGATFYKKVKPVLKQEVRDTDNLKSTVKNYLLNKDKINKLLRIKASYFDLPQERYVFGIEKEINEKGALGDNVSYFEANCHDSILVLEL